MSEIDNLLQQRLHAMEEGTPLDAVLTDLPAEATELTPLLRLASATRRLPQPELSTAGQQTLRRRISSEAQGYGRPLRRSNGRGVRRALIPAFAGFAVMALFLVVVFGTGVWIPGPQNVHAAALLDVSGQVEVASSSQDSAWSTVSDGAKVTTGQRIRTGEGSSVTLVFFEGSRTVIGPQAELELTRLDGDWGNVLQIELTQLMGTTEHHVIPLQGNNGIFMVNTPTGVARVHGTTFSVTVDPRGQAYFYVDSGRVTVSNAGGDVAVTAGQATLSRAALAPESPSYQFTFDDQLTEIQGDTWVGSGVPFQIAGETLITGNPQVGDYVLVQGRILDGNRWVADIVAPSSGQNVQYLFTGIIEAIGPESWQINGAQVLVNEVTELDSSLTVGDAVKVTYMLLEGDRWQALKIESLEAEEGTPTPQLTLTPQGTLTPPAPFVNCTGAEPQPKGQELATKYGVPYEEIMDWFCQGNGFGEIDLAYSLSLQSGVPVSEIFAWRASGLGWGEIQRQLSLKPTPTLPVTPTLTATPTLTVTLPVTGTPTSTPTVTPTPSITPTPVASPTPAATETGCTGANPHPQGQELAERYGVPYEEIMGWFCQNFGFGEIDLAYSLSLETGVPVTEIFALRQSGMGWGEIKKQLVGNPGKGPNK